MSRLAKFLKNKICDNCGEKFVDATTTKELLKKANELIKNGTEVDIRKFSVAA